MPVGDVGALTERLRELPALRGIRFEHPRSWSATADAYRRFLDGLDGAGASARTGGPTAGAAA